MFSFNGGGGVTACSEVIFTPGGGGLRSLGATFCGTGLQSELQPTAQRQTRARPATGIFLICVTDCFLTVSNPSC